MSISSSWIKEQVRKNDYEFSSHADIERQNDKISITEIENALINGELIEHYPSDRRGESGLVLGYGEEGYPIHIVCGKTFLGRLRIITVYIPTLPKWINERTRRKSDESL